MSPLPLAALVLIAADPTPVPAETLLLLKPARVFDGIAAQPHEGWVVLVRGKRIEKAGRAADQIRAASRTIAAAKGSMYRMTMGPAEDACSATSNIFVASASV